MALARKNSRSKPSWTKKKKQWNQSRFVVCVLNEDYEGSLELRKIYQALPDKMAEQRGFVRVIDESGEDYLYPEEFFAPIALPQGLKKALRAAS